MKIYLHCFIRICEDMSKDIPKGYICLSSLYGNSGLVSNIQHCHWFSLFIPITPISVLFEEATKRVFLKKKII